MGRGGRRKDGNITITAISIGTVTLQLRAFAAGRKAQPLPSGGTDKVTTTPAVSVSTSSMGIPNINKDKYTDYAFRNQSFRAR